MNSLTALYFTQNLNEHISTGLIIGNSAKANYLEKYNDDIHKGILLEKKIKDYSGNNPYMQRSLNKVSTKYSKHKEVIVNIFYDHLLAITWEKHSEISLEKFSDRLYQILLENLTLFPYKIRKYSPEMITQSWITGLTSIEGTHKYINLVSKRERFNVQMEYVLFELMENYASYREDFEKYFEGLKNQVVIEQEKILQTDKVILVSA